MFGRGLSHVDFNLVDACWSVVHPAGCCCFFLSLPHSLPTCSRKHVFDCIGKSPCIQEIHAWKSRRSWTGDAFCRQDADHSCMDITEQEVDFRWVAVPNNDEPDADGVPFQPRFVLQEIIFAHCPHLCRADRFFSERDCGLRVCDPADSRIRHLLKVQCLRTCQPSRGACSRG